MKKPQSLRDYLVQRIEYLQTNPEQISMYIENGRYRSTLANGLSFESSCLLVVYIRDYADNPDVIAFLILQWLKNNQSELLANLEKSKEALKFNAQILDNGKYDIMFEMELTERIIVKRQAGEGENYTFDYPPEPQYTAAQPAQECHLLDDDGNVLATWQSADAQEHIGLVIPPPQG